MTIDTYINYSDNNKLNKIIETVESNVSIILIDSTNLLRPKIRLSMRYYGTPSKPAYFNYCYISEFGRYYFTKERTYAQQYLDINLEVDPLSSWLSYLNDVEVIANRSSSRFDLYIPDRDLPIRADADVKVVEFYNGFTTEGNEEFILAVAGGYQPPTP